MKYYPRKCSVTGKGMFQGFMFNEGEAYACDEASAKKYLASLGLDPEKEFRLLDEAFAEDGDGDYWFYWTEWSEEDYWEDEVFTASGNVIIPGTHFEN